MDRFLTHVTGREVYRLARYSLPVSHSHLLADICVMSFVSLHDHFMDSQYMYYTYDNTRILIWYQKYYSLGMITVAYKTTLITDIQMNLVPKKAR